MRRGPWTFPDPRRGDFDDELAAIRARDVERHPGDPDARVTRIAGYARDVTRRSGAGSSRGLLGPISFAMEASALPTQAAPVPDRIAIWPVDDGRYGLDATFQGASEYEGAERHLDALKRNDVRHSLRQELGGGWTLRFGPLSAAEVGVALGAFVR